jgi:hypothetical protein
VNEAQVSRQGQHLTIKILGTLSLESLSRSDLAVSHLSVPTAVLSPDGSRIRLFVSSRDDQGRSRVFVLDLDPANPLEVSHPHLKLVLDLGAEEDFDGDGLLCTSVLVDGPESMHMLYVGFERNAHGFYRLLTGLAHSIDGGDSFTRSTNVPLLERAPDESTVRGAAVFAETIRLGAPKGIVYAGGSGWVTTADGRRRPHYSLREQPIGPGLAPIGPSRVLLEPRSDEHGFGRTGAIDCGDHRCVLLSVRMTALSSYRLQTATIESDGRWVRDTVQLRVLEGNRERSLDHLMFASSVQTPSEQWLFLNGPDYGKDGVLVAKVEDE